MRVLRLGPVMGALLVAGCGGGRLPVAGQAGEAAAGVECAPFARQESGVQLYGAAWSWWDGASGRYARRSDPVPGAVLVFRRTARLPSGHVSVVADVAGASEIRVTQANWVHGRITRNEPVVDVSPGHDWTAVRVWWAPTGSLGATIYPTYGFVGPAGRTDLVADATPR